MARKLRAGDVFRFRGRMQGWGYGQILLSDIIQYIVVFEPKFADNTTLNDVVSSSVLLSGWTMDAKIYHGDWEIVGNISPIKFRFPQYKVNMSGQTWITDVNGKLLRLATVEESRGLSFKSSNSPIAFEKAFRAYHGDLPWEAYFDELRADL